jgi:hypothetical protein
MPSLNARMMPPAMPVRDWPLRVRDYEKGTIRNEWMALPSACRKEEGALIQKLIYIV